MKTEIKLETDNPNVKNVIRSINGGEGGVQVIKQTTESTGEEPTGEGETTEIITITRVYLGSI